MSSVKGEGPRPPLVALLDMARRRQAEELTARLIAAGYDDQRYAHNHVMGHLTFEGLRLTELAERAGITKQAMGELVSELEDLGYVERVPDPRDRRAKIIRFTARSRKAIAVAERIFDEMERDLAAELGARRVEDLRRTLTRMVGLGG